MAYMTNQQKRDLDHWLTTPPEYPENTCPKCHCEIWEAEQHSEELEAKGRNDEVYFVYTCPDENCGHKWVENE